MKPIQSTIAQIDQEILSLARDQNAPWVRVAKIIMEVEKSGHWQSTYSSFTEWMKHLAEQMGLGESNLWRYKKAADFYKSLRSQLRKAGIHAPALDRLPRNVRAENLELLDKLGRVISSEELIALAKDVLMETPPGKKPAITREQLRTKWKAARRVLVGKTARGMKGSAPTVDPEDEMLREWRRLTQLLNILSGSQGNWLSSDAVATFSLFDSLRPERPADLPETSKIEVLTAFAVVRITENDGLQYHGFEFREANSKDANYRFFEEQDPYYDYIWIVFDNFEPVLGVKSIPKNLGILQVKNERIELIRPAGKTSQSGKRTIALANTLLSFVLRV